MKTNRFAVCSLLLLVFVVASACGAPAATQSPAERYQSEYEAPAAQEPDYGAAATEAPAEQYAPVYEAQPDAKTQSDSNLQPPNDQPVDDMYFQDYGVNPFVDTEDDQFSTFALDVDTGSYTLSRSYINDGNIPPEDAVRVEEFVNYFDQGYPQPPDRHAFGIYIDGGPTPYSQSDRYQMLRFGIQGYEVPEDERKDVSLTFVIDVSGSMAREDRLELVKQSLELLVERLGSHDQVSIVVYGSEARVVLEPTPGDEERTIMRAIDRLSPEGSTNAEAGLRLGYSMADEAFNSESINRVILCSDGVANVGETDAGSIWEEIERYAGKDITLTTIGFGMGNYNDVLMEQLADKGNGFYSYVDDLDEAERLFVDNLTSTLQVIAMDAKVQVEFNPEVVSRYRLVGFENRAVADEDFRDNKVDAGEIGAGHSVTALYEVKLHPRADGPIATVFLRWQDPETREITEMLQEVSTRELSKSFHEADPHFQWSVIVAQYAEILRKSKWVEEYSMDDVLDEARRVSEYFDHDQNVEEFVKLVRKVSRLSD